jgi:hypothetical protein
MAAVVVSCPMGRLRLLVLVTDAGIAVALLMVLEVTVATNGLSSFATVKSLMKSMLSECSLWDVPNISSSSLPPSDKGVEEDPADDDRLSLVALPPAVKDRPLVPLLPPPEGLEPLRATAAGIALLLGPVVVVLIPS